MESKLPANEDLFSFIFFFLWIKPFCGMGWGWGGVGGRWTQSQILAHLPSASWELQLYKFKYLLCSAHMYAILVEVQTRDHLAGFVQYVRRRSRQPRKEAGKHFCFPWTTGMPEEGLLLVWPWVTPVHEIHRQPSGVGHQSVLPSKVWVVHLKPLCQVHVSTGSVSKS